MKFEELIHNIEATHQQLSAQAIKQVNSFQTMRNWLIGFYIVEFEQNGEDRAIYGNKTLVELSKRLKYIVGMSLTNLKLFRQFYLNYPILRAFVLQKTKIISIGQTTSDQLKVSKSTAQSDSYQHLMLPTETIINTLSVYLKIYVTIA